MKLEKAIWGSICAFIVVAIAMEVIRQFNLLDEDIKVIVEEVRVLTISEKKNKVKDGHPVVGSVVGCLIARTPGAIIGTVVGDSVGGDGLSKVEVSELLGCAVIVRLPDQTTAHLKFGRDGISYQFRRLIQASLLRKGDTISIVRRVNKKNGEILWYEWRGK